jgi:iron complex outermembrane receptor protein
VGQDTFDLDFQCQTKLSCRHNAVWGFGYRNNEIFFGDTFPFSYDPNLQSYDIISYFIQDTIMLREDELYLTLGVKFEHNNFTDFEYQPTVRVSWTPDERTSIWGAVSRAVRTPSVIERNLIIFNGLIRGDKGLESEDLLSYEFGIRRQPSDRFYWSLAAFFNRYDKLIGLDPLNASLVASNNGHGDTYGYEWDATYEINPCWRLNGNYSFLVEDVAYGPSGLPLLTGIGRTPRNQFYVRSAMDLSCCTTLDVMFRYVDSLPAGDVPHYFVMDIRYAWQPCDGLELSVVGQNLFEANHTEFVPSVGSTAVQSGVYAMISREF